MSDVKYELYKKATDEFRLLYNAFRESGFTKEEAFELVKCYCTSANLQGIYERTIDHELNARKYSDIKRNLHNLKKRSDDLKEEP